MEDSRPTARSSATPVVATAVILLLLGAPLFYALSSGPVIWLAQNGYINPEWLEYLYGPLGYVMNHSTAIDAVMQWYLRFFVDR